MDDKAAVTRGQVYLNNLATLTPEAHRAQIPTTKEKSDLMALSRYVIDKYTSVQRRLSEILNKEMRKEIKSAKGKKRRKVEKSKYVLSMSWKGNTHPLNSEYPSRLVKNFMKTIMNLIARVKAPSKGRGTFTDKNGNKQHIIDTRLLESIRDILSDPDFRNEVGTVIYFDGRYVDFGDVVDMPGSVFNRLYNAVSYDASRNAYTGDGMVYNLALKDFVYMVLRMSDRYNSKTTNVQAYLDSNPSVNRLLRSTDKRVQDFTTTLHLRHGAEKHKQGTIVGNQLIMSANNTYMYAGSKDGFKIYTNSRGASKYVIGTSIYQEKYVTGLDYTIVNPANKIDVFILADNETVSFRRITYYKGVSVNDDLTAYNPRGQKGTIYRSESNNAFYSSNNVKRGTNDLGLFLRNSLVTYNEASYIRKPDIAFTDIKNLKYVSEIIFRMQAMKDGFSRDNMPTLSQIAREKPTDQLVLKITPEDYVPKQYTALLDQFQGSDIDERVYAFFTRYLQAEEDHDFVKKVLSPEEKQVYNYVLARNQ